MARLSKEEAAEEKANWWKRWKPRGLMPSRPQPRISLTPPRISIDPGNPTGVKVHPPNVINNLIGHQEPMSPDVRLGYYFVQNNTDRLTPAQTRRARKKRNRLEHPPRKELV